MKKTFHVYYDVRFYNGCVEVEAEDEDEAQALFDDMPDEDLLEHTNNMAVDVEGVYSLEDVT